MMVLFSTNILPIFRSPVNGVFHKHLKKSFSTLKNFWRFCHCKFIFTQNYTRFEKTSRLLQRDV